MTCCFCTLISKKIINDSFYDYVIYCPEIAAAAKPGQFVDVKCDGFTLRRPISICDIDAQNGNIRIVFEVRGEGTDWLASKTEGESVDVLGPLGNGFEQFDKNNKVFFVGGGIGVPPLLAAAKIYGKNAVVFLGFRNSGAAILEEDFKKIGAEVVIATDDGSEGYHGLVTDLLKTRLESEVCSTVFACGPKPMLKATALAVAQKNNDCLYAEPIKCFVSMEERMACGTGACLCCACKVKEGDQEHYLHVCKNGPVFDANKIVW